MLQIYKHYQYDESGVSYAKTKDTEMNGLIRLQIKGGFYNKVFCKGDTCKTDSVKVVYTKDWEDLVYKVCIPYKF